MIIYVLCLENNKFYIGKTNKSAEERLYEHRHNTGSTWTRLHKPIGIEETLEDADDFDEDKITKKYMAKYGIDNVRGGSYCTTIIDKQTRKFLEKEIASMTDRCYTCNNFGHFAKDCELEEEIENLYKKSKHTWVNFFETTCDILENLEELFVVKCSRCGRSSHSDLECYARYDTVGNPIF